LKGFAARIGIVSFGTAGPKIRLRMDIGFGSPWLAVGVHDFGAPPETERKWI
jgi:hypothetical protein